MAPTSGIPDDPSMDAPTEPPPTEPTAGPPRPPLPRPRDGWCDASTSACSGEWRAGWPSALGIDVVVVRLGFVVAAFFGGLGVIAYVLGWILLPAAPATSPATSPRGDRRQLLGYGLVAVGLLVVGGRLGWSFQGGGIFWPLVLVGLGGAVLWLRTRDDDGAPPPPPPPPPPGPDPSDGPTRPDPTPGAAVDLLEPSTLPVSTAVDRPAATDPPTRERSFLGAVTVSTLLVLCGAAWILDASGAWDIDLGVLAAVALAIVGAALVASTWYGRARGLIALGIPLVLLVGAFGLVDVPLQGGIGDPTHRPRSVGAIDHEYQLAIGNLSVDLRDVDFAGARRHVRVQVGIGQLNVTVPTGVRVVLDAHAGAGGVTAFGRSAHECCPTDVHRVSSGTSGGGVLYLDAEVGAGHVDVTRREESLRASS